MTMFPHTVTVYNTGESASYETENHVTVLRGVFYDARKGVNVIESGLTNADSVNLIIPFSVDAVDGVTGNKQKYLPPKEYETAMDKAAHWTIKTDDCFFVKNEVVRPDLSFQQINAAFDYVHRVTSVDEKDFGSLKHWEVGGA